MKEKNVIKQDLIFDLGFHNGDDSDFYLVRGFNVVAVEANPELAAAGTERFGNYISDKRLVLINKAISARGNEEVDFYIHPTKSDWSSCYKTMAESDGSVSKIISVKTVSLEELCRGFGIPWYMKVDIEGCDVVIANQLRQLDKKPQYVSFELSKQNYADIFSYLFLAGYKKFQLINQLNNADRKKEGISYEFTRYSSGLFGDDLPKDRWLSYDEALSRYLKYRDLKMIDNQELALGWLDLHASL